MFTVIDEVPESDSPDALFNNSFPSETVTVPLKSLSPVIVMVPEPSFVRLPVPVMLPENVVDVSFEPAVRVALPRSTVPAPASDPIVSEILLKSIVAPLATVNAVCVPPELPSDPLPVTIAASRH